MGERQRKTNNLRRGVGLLKKKEAPERRKKGTRVEKFLEERKVPFTRGKGGIRWFKGDPTGMGVQKKGKKKN